MTDWAARVLDEVDAGAAAAVGRLAELVRVPSIGGTDAECDIQAMLATELGTAGLEVDHWQLPLAELLAEPDFPGCEVERSEAWGLVGRLPGTGEGPSLMFDGHVDVVPTGDLAAWSRPDPFSGVVEGGELHGRGACDIMLRRSGRSRVTRATPSEGRSTLRSARSARSGPSGPVSGPRPGVLMAPRLSTPPHAQGPRLPRSEAPLL